jgi:hypothetical protein
MSTDKKRSGAQPPAPDDPKYRRTCTRCGHTYSWTVARCEKCRNPEFALVPPQKGNIDEGR